MSKRKTKSIDEKSDEIHLRTTPASDNLVTIVGPGENSSELSAKAQENCFETEKTRPCGMRYPEPFRTRPNFFIPLMSVGSYVVPFFILVLLNAIFRIIPGIPEFQKELNDFDGGWHHSDEMFALVAFLFLSAPMGIGALTASVLKKFEKMRTKTKLITWFSIVLSVCVIECLFVALVRYAFQDTFGTH